MQQAFILLTPEEQDRWKKAIELVYEMQDKLETLLFRPELQKWVTIAHIRKEGLLGGRTKSHESARKVLDEAVASGAVRMNTIDKTYNLNDLLLFRKKFETNKQF